VAKDRDVEGLYNLLDEGAVFHSRVVHTPQIGKAITGKYLSAAFDVFSMRALPMCAGAWGVPAALIAVHGWPLKTYFRMRKSLCAFR
jgi:hypothetical protein